MRPGRKGGIAILHSGTNLVELSLFFGDFHAVSVSQSAHPLLAEAFVGPVDGIWWI